MKFGDLPKTPRFCRPAEIIEGLLHAGSKLTIGGPPKARKTWLFHDISCSVASGVDFLGRKCTQGKVLLIDLELNAFFLHQRIWEVARSKNLDPGGLDKLDVLSLRGHPCDLDALSEQVLGENRKYSLIVIDPLYKLLSGIDDKQGKEVLEICSKVECLAVETDAAILMGMHFSKGNPSNKFSMDRISGSGVYARDADTIMTLTPHPEDDKFVAEFTLRNFAPIPPVVLGWEHPRYVLNPDINPMLLTTARRKPGFPREQALKRILAIIAEEGEMERTTVIEKANGFGFARDPVRDLVDELIKDGVLETSGRRPIKVRLAEGGGQERAA